MDAMEVRASLIRVLESTVEFAEAIGDSTTAYLIERALDEARSKQIMGSMPRPNELN
jgi:hypothetical protein